MCKHRGLNQSQVSERMGVSVARISQIEAGDISTRDVLDRYVSALGGTLMIITDFGDEQLKAGWGHWPHSKGTHPIGSAPFSVCSCDCPGSYTPFMRAGRASS